MLVADGTHAFGVGQGSILSPRGIPKSMAPKNRLLLLVLWFYYRMPPNAVNQSNRQTAVSLAAA